MGSWTRRDWVIAGVLIVGGLVGARLFPEFWDTVVIPAAAVGFIGMMVWHARRAKRRAREEEAKRQRERFRGWGQGDEG
jgi:hypothetical protein